MGKGGDGLSRTPAAKSDEAVFIPATEVQARDTFWIWYPYIPAGSTTLLGGRPKVGKGLVMADIAARLSRGDALPDGTPSPGRCLILWAESEDGLDTTIMPRLIAAGADLDYVMLAGKGRLPVNMLQGLCEKATARGLPGLIVLSSLKDYLAYMPAKRQHHDKDIETREVMHSIGRIVEGSRVGIVCIGHLNKKPDLEAFDRFSGSGAYVQVARSFLGVQMENEAEDTRRFMMIGGNLGRQGADLIYTPRHMGKPGQVPVDPQDAYVRLDWEEAPANKGASDAFAAPTVRGGKQTAGRWLAGFLRGKSWVAKEAVVIPAAEQAGYSRRAVETAVTRDQGNMFAQRSQGGVSYWGLFEEVPLSRTPAVARPVAPAS